jgi:hypothetical protein
VRDACLWLPEAEEFISHGSPNFRIRGKTFATYAVNHHGDGRVALWLNALPGSQELHVGAEPMHFFVPPYVGPRGWLGVVLDRGIAWKRVAALVREAYEKVAPADLRSRLGNTPAVKAPGKALSASQIDRSSELALHFEEDAAARLDTGRPQLQGLRLRAELQMVRMNEI